MFGAMIRVAERWRAIKITEVKRRQMTALTKEPDQEYEADIGLDTKQALRQQIPSAART